ncbi:helix-turn-helix domain-containing protein [Yinghuangia sp. ASG 101]|uniref:helix-turn-helix domain-containing protein n=1 Tax=Yinghuangia sp. ASG 101 TaxID=2896848 RepID=UPI001E5652FF|nr:helix-turn-helix domain-containing protein [Yinghuangia sp. ASG 101]UGQ09652.1 helix-turn-helix domain-containing protein [Yinghuangia sp. ASG 101]
MAEKRINAADMPRGVLYPELTATKIRLARHAPSPGVGRFVEYYWIVAWDLRGKASHESHVLSHPNVHLVFEEPEAAVYGIIRGSFRRRIHGLGHVLGVRFRPGAFRPLLGRPVADIVDRVLPAATLFDPAAVHTTQAAVLGTRDDTEMVAYAEEFLSARLPAPDRAADEAAEIVARITSDPSLTRVDDVAGSLGMSVRRLQRLFAEYVGASPKWVLRRARLHEAAERAAAGRRIDWAALAVELGYADQAHLTRDFTAAVGAPPGAYARS